MTDEAHICTLVLFGGNGDLAGRMLLPSLYHLDSDGLLPPTLRIIGVARTIADTPGFRDEVREKLQTYIAKEHFEEDVWQRFAERLHAVQVDASQPADFERLGALIGSTDACDLIYYFSTAPRLYGAICRGLHDAGLVTRRSRVVLEKPIGTDLASSEKINAEVGAVFDEAQVFRVDHYLGKETVQNLLALRFANVLFEPLWNRAVIDHVQITIAETVGVEGRWSYYDDAGALRDMVQNHMLQLLCLVAMEPPASMDADAVRDEKVKVLRALRPIGAREVASETVRGQYTAGAAGGQPVPGYLEEAGGQPSNTETFVALRCAIDNWRWSGVPFYLRTGKRLPQRHTEIYIQFRELPHSIFTADSSAALKPNRLIIRLQPEEQIRLKVMNKVPGLTGDGLQLQEVPLNLSWSDTFQRRRRRIAYERLLLDAIKGNKTLFVRRDEVAAAWAWIDGIAAGWTETGMGVKPYVAGSWGPTAAVALTERHGHSWHE
ncbi:MAG: glucose-6-phosphate dehydrogenase [Alphaproteobacteria bacterium]|nr:MAG: glucose-6-phosphate dehydrogenase [Alphaproteobacteria bacterium]